MTKAEAEQYVRACGEDEGPDGDESLLRDLFVALFECEPDQDDWDNDLWSLICAAVRD